MLSQIVSPTKIEHLFNVVIFMQTKSTLWLGLELS